MADKFWAEIYSVAPGGSAVVAAYTDLDAMGPTTAVEAARAWARQAGAAQDAQSFLRVLQGKETICSEPLGAAAAG